MFGYLPDGNGLRKALDGAGIVVVTAGIARKPGMTRDGKSLYIIIIRLTYSDLSRFV